MRVGEVIASLSDSAVYQFGPVTIAGADLKAAYFALLSISVTDDTVPAMVELIMEIA